MNNEKNLNVYSFNDECYVYLGDYKQLKQQYEQLKINWYKLKEYLFNTDVFIDYTEVCNGTYINYDELINVMQELEKVNENEKNKG